MHSENFFKNSVKLFTISFPVTLQTLFSRLSKLWFFQISTRHFFKDTLKLSFGSASKNLHGVRCPGPVIWKLDVQILEHIWDKKLLTNPRNIPWNVFCKCKRNIASVTFMLIFGVASVWIRNSNSYKNFTLGVVCYKPST